MESDCAMGCATTMCVDYCGGDGNAPDDCVNGCMDAVMNGGEDNEGMVSGRKLKTYLTKTMTV